MPPIVIPTPMGDDNVCTANISLNAVESIGKGSWLALTFRSAG